MRKLADLPDTEPRYPTGKETPTMWCNCPECHTRYNGSDRYGGHCTQCHATFANNDTAAAHRTGPYNPHGRRHCLTVDQMTALGWRHTPHGWTRSKPMTQQTAAKLRGQP